MEVQIPPGWNPPDITLMIAATPRSGTEMLCRLVDSTGLFRWTREAFTPEKYREFGLHPQSIRETLAIMDTVSRTRANLMSLKLFWHQMRDLLKDDTLDLAFPNVSYVFLRRDDILGQAISFVRGMQTKIWGSDFQPNGIVPQYDDIAITRAVHELAGSNAWWEFFFATRKARVLRLTYEQVEADPLGATASIVAHMGLGPCSADVSAQTMQKQRDVLSEEWRERYLSANRGGLSGLNFLHELPAVAV